MSHSVKILFLFFILLQVAPKTIYGDDSLIEKLEDSLLGPEIKQFVGPFSKDQLSEVWEEIQKEWFKKTPETLLPLFTENGDIAPYLVTYDGKTLQNHKDNRSKLEHGLLTRLKYPTFITYFMENYKRLIRPLFYSHLALPANIGTNEKMQRVLEKWFYEHALILGSEKHSAYPLLLKVPVLQQFIQLNPKFKAALTIFFNHIESFHKKPVHSPNKTKKIVIITSTGAGGGHFAVAQAIESYIKKNLKHFDVRIVNTKEINEEQNPERNDVMLQMTGTLHSEDVFNEILQKRNNIARARAYWQTLSYLRYFIDDYSIENLVHVVQKEAPDLIISCLHHRAEYIHLSYALDIPQLIVSTDFSLQENLFRFLQIGDPSLIKILAASKSSEFFSKFSEDLALYRKMGITFYDPMIEQSITAYKNRDINWHGLKKIFPILDFMGIPIRPGIKYNRSPEYLADLRNKYDIPKNEKIVTIVMGKQGAGQIKNIVASIIVHKEELTEKIHFLVVCGENKGLYNALMNTTKKETYIHPLRSLDSEEMSDLYNLSDLIISKPGGITTQEILTTSTPLLAYNYYLWEKPNLKFLRKMGLGYTLELKTMLTKRINEILKIGKPSGISADPDEWKLNLKNIITNIFPLDENLAQAQDKIEGKSEEADVEEEKIPTPIPYLNHTIKLGKRRALVSEKNISKITNQAFTSAKQPHIFFIVADAVRAKSVTPSNAPNILSFADESVTSHIAVASATATHHSMFSMLHARPATERTQRLNKKWLSGSPFLRILKDKLNYTINLFGLSHLIWKMGEEPKKAYELKTDMPHFFLSEESNMLLNFSSGSQSLVNFSEFNQRTGWFTERNGWNKRAVGDAHTIDSLEKFLDVDNLAKPTLNFVHFFATNDPYSWPDELGNLETLLKPHAPNVDWWDQDVDVSWKNRIAIRNSYINAIKGFDLQFDKLQRLLKSKINPTTGKSLYDESLIILVSDHGEYLWELHHLLNKEGQPWRTSFGHNDLGFSYTSDVPMYYKFPKDVASEMRHKRQAFISDGSDIMPTVFDFLDVNPKTYMQVATGESLFNPDRKRCKITASPNLEKLEHSMVFNNGLYKAFVKFDKEKDPMNARGLKVLFMTDLHDQFLTLEDEEFESSFKKNFSGCIQTLFL